MWNKFLPAALVLAFSLVALMPESTACKISETERDDRDPREVYDVIAKGRVLRTEPVEVTEPFGDGHRTYEATLAWIEVERAWKGVDRRVLEVITEESDCTVIFEVGRYYLIYAWWVDERTLEIPPNSSFQITLDSDTFEYLLGEPSVVYE